MLQEKRKYSLYLFLFFLLWYLVFSSGHLGGDSFTNFLTTESLVLDGNLNIVDHPEREFQIPEYNESYEAAMNVPDGYGKFGIGMVIVQVPFFVAGYIISLISSAIPRDYITLFAVSMTNPFVVALFCVIFFHLLKKFELSRKRSLYLTVAMGIGTFIFPYTRQGFIEPLTLLCIYSAAFFLFRWKEESKLWLVISAGALLGGALLTRVDSIIYVPVFVGYLCYKENKIRINREAVLLGMIVIFTMLLYLVFNYFRYKSAANFGGYRGIVAEYLTLSPFVILHDIYAILISPGSSLLVYAPVVVFSVFGIKSFLRKYTDKGIFLLALIFINIMFISFLELHYTGGVAWGPRYNLLIVPALIIFGGYGIDYIKNVNLRRYILVFILIIGFLHQMPSVLVNSARMTKRALNIISFEVQHFTVEYSPVVLGYYHIGSTVANVLFDKHLRIPIHQDIFAPHPEINKAGHDYPRYVSLEGIDEFDLWFVHIFRYDFIPKAVKILVFFILIGMISGLVILGRILYKNAVEDNLQSSK